MAQLIKINEFPVTNSVDENNDVFPIASDADGIAKKISANDLKAYLGTVQEVVPRPLAITDPIPTVDGVYVPTDIGVYPNGLEKKEGYDTKFLLSEGVWTVIENEILVDTSSLQPKNEPALITDSKTITGGINEVAATIQSELSYSYSEVEPYTSATYALVEVSRFNNKPAIENGILKKVTLNIGDIGSGKIVVVSKNTDNSFYSLKHSLTFNFSTTGIIELQDGVDFNGIDIAVGDLIGYYGITSRAGYHNETTGDAFYFNGDASGDLIPLTAAGVVIEMGWDIEVQGATKGQTYSNLNAINQHTLQISKNSDAITELKEGGGFVSEQQKIASINDNLPQRTSVAYNNLGELFPSGSSVKEAVNKSFGVLLTKEDTNLFGANTHFESGSTGWTFTKVGGDPTSSSEVVNDITFTEGNAIKLYGGDLSGASSEVKRQVVLSAGNYTIAFAVYSPDRRPRTPDFRLISGSTYITLGIEVSPTGKTGWWWVSYNFTKIDNLNRTYGFVAYQGQTFHVGAAVISKTDGTAKRYISGTKSADKYNQSVILGKQFTAGFVVKATQLYNSNSAEIVVLSEFRSLTGDSYRIEYRKTPSVFAVVKTISGVSTEVLSNSVKYNPDAVIGVAVQQSRQELKLFITVPKGIIIDFDDAKMSVYNNGFPVMDKYGIKGTTYAIINNIGVTDSMAEKELKELDRAGWNISSHTVSHADLPTLDYAGQYAEIGGAMNYLRERGYAYDLIATPFGNFNNDTLKVFRDLGMRAHRGYSSLGYGGNLYPYTDRWEIKSDPVSQAESGADAILRVDSRMQDYNMIHLTFHGIADPGAADTIYNYDYNKFVGLIEHIALKNYPTYTFSEVIDALYNLKIIGSVEEFSIVTDTASDDITELFLGSDDDYSNHFNGAFSGLFVTEDILGSRELAAMWDCKF